MDNVEVNSYINLSPLSAFLILFCTVTLCTGVKNSAIFNICMTALNIGVILFVVVLGATSFSPATFSASFLPQGFSAVMAGTGVVFFSFVGFDSVSTLAGEVKRPSRDLPVGICGTLAVATCLYVAVSVVVCGMLPYLLIDPSSPLAYAFEYVGQGWAAAFIAAASVVALVATTLCSLLGQPRIFFQMAVDGLLWPLFKTVDSRGIPVWGTVISGVFSALIALCINLDNLTQMISVGTLMAFALVCAGVVIIRFRPPSPLSPGEDAQRRRLFPPAYIPWVVLAYCVAAALFAASCVNGWPLFVSVGLLLPLLGCYGLLQVQKQVNVPSTFACPLVPLLPCLGILANIFIIVSLEIASLYRVLIWSSICMVIYLTYGIRHSRLNRLN